MASHTATGEWQSFELRMRKRRAERLLLRAGTAADIGHADEARECLEEARRLAPGLAGIAAVEHKLNAPAAASSPRAAAHRLPLIAVTALVLVATGVVAAGLRHSSQPLSVARDFHTLQLTSPVSAVGTAADTSPAPAPTPASRPAPTVAPPAVDTPAPAAMRAASETPAPTPAPAATVTPARIGNPVASSTSTVERGGDAAAALPVTSFVPDPAPPKPAPVVALEAAEAVPANLPGKTRLTEPVVETTDARAALRGVLDRYAAAYDALDAGAAQRVWPEVDRGALARAFDDLASQHVSLGECRIDVAGPTARATCAGSTTWAPKVGDDTPRTARRQWSFELVRSADTWHITSARVQNR